VWPPVKDSDRSLFLVYRRTTVDIEISEISNLRSIAGSAGSISLYPRSQFRTNKYVNLIVSTNYLLDTALRFLQDRITINREMRRVKLLRCIVTN